MNERLRKVIHAVAVLAALTMVNGIALGIFDPEPTAARTEFGGRLVIGAASVLFAIVMVGFFTVRALNWWLVARRRTATAQGTVIGRSDEESPSDGAMMYQRVLHVRYYVRRRPYDLQWSPSHFHTNVGWFLTRIDARYPNGTEVSVRYDPSDVENAWVGRVWGAPLFAAPLSVALLGAVLVSGYLMGSFVTQYSPVASLSRGAGSSGASNPGASGDTSRLALREAEPYRDISCSCVSEVHGRDERIQLAVSMSPRGNDAIA